MTLLVLQKYKECLDIFLEGLIDGGGALKRKLLEAEYKKDPAIYKAVLDTVNQSVECYV